MKTSQTKHDIDQGVPVEPLVSSCSDCGAILTAEEAHWYEHRCEDCEQEWWDRLDLYRTGGDDPVLDVLFGG